MLANSEMNISPSEGIATNLTGIRKGESRLGRRRKIRGTADQPRMLLSNRVQHFARGISAGYSFRVRRECRDFFVPALRRFTVLNRGGFSCQLRMLFLVSRKQTHPVAA